MKTVEEMKVLFKDAQDKTKVVFLKSFIKDNPTWDNFIDSITKKYNDKNLMNPWSNDERYVQNNGKQTDIFIYNKLDLQVWNVVCPDGNGGILGLDSFPEADVFYKYFVEVTESDRWGIKSLINFAGCEANYNAHKDLQDVISWQCVDTVEYRIYENFDSEYERPLDVSNKKYDSYLLEPGDVIFLPKGVIHEVFPHNARATLIMNFNLKEKGE
jgi:hypothetical protein